MRIDAHQHFWNYNPARHAWISKEMSLLKRNFLPADLGPELAANGMDASVAVQADQSEHETQFLLQLAESNPRIAGVIGWVDLCSPELPKRLDGLSRQKKLRGFRHIAQSEPDDRFLANDSFVQGVSQLKKYGFVYDILIYPKQLPAARELVEKLPEQKFVIDHLAKPDIKNETNSKEWAGHIWEIAKNPNVYCKVSGMVTEADWRAWRPEGFKPYLDIVFEAFGSDRLLFGSDWPVCLVAASYKQVVGIVDEYSSDRPETERNKIFGENAIRFYGLEMAQHGSAD